MESEGRKKYLFLSSIFLLIFVMNKKTLAAPTQNPNLHDYYSAGRKIVLTLSGKNGDSHLFFAFKKILR